MLPETMSRIAKWRRKVRKAPPPCGIHSQEDGESVYQFFVTTYSLLVTLLLLMQAIIIRLYLLGNKEAAIRQSVSFLVIYSLLVTLPHLITRTCFVPSILVSRHKILTSSHSRLS